MSDSSSTAAVESRWRLRVLLAVGAVVIALDQLTKWWAIRALSDGPNDVVWTLRFRLIGNTGAAFSKGEGLGPVLGIIITVVVVAMFVFRDRIQVGAQFVAYSAIFGGAIGNLLDRFFRGDGWWRGAVVDFIDFQWYPVFNVADIAVVCGGIALLVMSWWANRPVPETDRDTAA